MKIASLNFHMSRVGTGQPFVWSHGLMTSMAVEDAWNIFDWTQLVGCCELVRYDARGHGKSEGSRTPQDYQWSCLADDMLAVADSLGCVQYTVGGISMGCATSLFAALRAPRQVRSLVLATPPTAWQKRVAQVGMYDQLASFVEAKGLAPTIEMLRQKPILPAWARRENPAMNDVFLEGIGAMDPRAVVAILRGAKLCQFPVREEIRKIEQPALILAWPEDSGHPFSVAEELHAILPRSRLVVARSLEEAKTWTKEIRDFLSALPRH